MTYPLEFRRKVLEIIEKEGLTLDEASERFRIGRASLWRWTQRLEPQTTRCKPTVTVDRIKLAADVRMHPDAYLHERAQRLGVSKSGIAWALKRMNISCKKNTQTPQGKRKSKN